MTITINVVMTHYRVGKRAKTMIPHTFVVSQNVYYYLYDHKDVEHWNHHFSVEITGDIIEELDKLCITVSEMAFLKDVKKVYTHDKIIVEQVFIKNRFNKVVEKVDLNNKLAYVKSANGELSPVNLSDKAVFQNIKEKDEVEITVLQNDKCIVTEVSNSYDENEEKMELQRQLDEMNELIGNY